MHRGEARSRRTVLSLIGLSTLGSLTGCTGEETGTREGDDAASEDAADRGDVNGDDTSGGAKATDTGSESGDGDHEGEGEVGGDDDPTRYANERMGYEIAVPGGWTVDDTYPEDLVLDDGEDRIVVSVFAVEERPTRSEIGEGAIANTEFGMEAVEVLSESETSVGSGEVARVVDLRYRDPFDGVERTLRSRLVLVPAEGVVYQIEVVSEREADEEAFDALAGEAVDSFSITGEPEEVTPSVESLTTYTNDAYGYRIAYPENWDVWELGPTEVYINDWTREREIAVFVVDGRPVGTLDELRDEILTMLELEYDEVGLEDEREERVEGGGDARILDVVYEDPADARGPRRSSLLVTAEEDVVYLVEVRSVAATFENGFGEVASAVIDSFALGDRTRATVRPFSDGAELTEIPVGGRRRNGIGRRSPGS
ncbi:hypothetical protein [Natronorarus salvus]|uniref:hypothetical protein n=1 Tax=Natronorarus salvus TaxID=3117733 RepID=UPI002F262B7D